MGGEGEVSVSCGNEDELDARRRHLVSPMSAPRLGKQWFTALTSSIVSTQRDMKHRIKIMIMNSREAGPSRSARIKGRSQSRRKAWKNIQKENECGGGEVESWGRKKSCSGSTNTLLWRNGKVFYHAMKLYTRWWGLQMTNVENKY